jgi:FkbM family methyltransferase
MLPQTDIIETNGCKFILFKKNDIVSDSIRHTGGFEQALLKIANAILSECEDGVVLDIGANLGVFTIPLAKTFPHIKFNAYEPQRVIYYQLCGNIIINSLHNVYAYEYAISDREEEVEIQLPNYMTEGNIGAFSIDPEVREKAYEASTKGEVEFMISTYLDALNIENIRLIKIDVEGLEMAVIRGAVQTLTNNGYPPIMFEAWTHKEWFQPRRQELYKLLEDLGYEITKLGENNLAQHNSKPKFNIEIN